MAKGAKNFLSLVVSLCISQGIMATSVREVTFEDTGYDDFLFNEDIVFDTMSRSRLDCGRYCEERGNCVGFTHARNSGSEGMSGTCRGYSHINISGSSSHKSGAKTFTRSAETKQSTAPETVTASAWLGKNCIDGSDCPTFFNTLCITGQCLCRPELYYSIGSNTCVETCEESDVGSTFLEYRKTAIVNENLDIDISNQADLAPCQADCVHFPWCRAVAPGGPGYLCTRFGHFLTTDVTTSAPASWILYKRTCA